MIALRHSLLLTLFAVLAGCSSPDTGGETVAAPAPPHVEPVSEAWSFDEARQFDFWIGEWDVNLRMLQEDLTWKDSVAARTHIWRILDGKAILELWDSESIKGFSLRYFDRESGKWKLWLNWPGADSSGGSGLEGEFRHGRGDFYSTFRTQDGQEGISRYSFNDISENSLRWDDGYSSDGGKSWAANWIMEFTRTAAAPPWPLAGPASHTWDDGSRCDREEFRLFEKLAGGWTGTMTVDAEETEYPATLTAHKTLGGCAVIVFLQYGTVKEFRFATFNTHAAVFEENRLDSLPGTGLDVRYGTSADGVVTLVPRGDPTGPPVVWDLSRPGTVAVEERTGGDEDTRVRRGVFSPS